MLHDIQGAVEVDVSIHMLHDIQGAVEVDVSINVLHDIQDAVEVDVSINIFTWYSGCCRGWYQYKRIYMIFRVL